MLVFEKYFPLQLTYFVSAIFGTWPLFAANVHSIGLHENTENRFSLSQVRIWLKRYFIYCAWLLVAVGAPIYYVIHSERLHPEASEMVEYFKLNTINKKLVLAENWTFRVTTLVNMLVTYFTSRHLPELMQLFSVTSSKLDKVIPTKETQRLCRGEFRRSIFWFVSSYMTIILTMAVEYSGLFSIQRETNFLNVLFQDMGKLSMMTFDLQFANICGRLGTLFGVVNAILDNICKNQTYLGGYTYCRQNTGPTKISYSNRYLAMRELNEVHRTLCDFVARISLIYQIQIALNAFVCFFNTVGVLFTTISQYRANTDWTLWISGLLWVTFYVIRVIMVCVSAAIVIEQAYEPKKYLSYIDDQGLDREQKFQVELFLERLSSVDIRFKLCGLMTVDKSFLSAACLGIVTYLVIALQYSYTTTTVPSKSQNDAVFRAYSVAYYFSKISGSMPFKIDRTHDSTFKREPQWCRKGVTFALIYIGLVVLSMITTKEVSNLTKFKGKQLTSIHDRTQMIVAPMFVWSVILTQIFVIASFILLPIQLANLNGVFREFRLLVQSEVGVLLFGDGTKAEKMVRNVNRNTWKIIIFYIFLAIGSAISSFNRIRLSATWTFLIMVDVVVKKMQALSLCVQFCALCDILLHCFYSVNENLIALKYRRRDTKNETLHPMLREMISPTTNTLRSLSHTHSALCNILEQVDRVYQIQNLFGIVVCTLKMLPHLFLTGIILTYSNFKILHTSFFLWPAQYLYRVFMLCESATKVTNEAAKTFHLVSTLYDERTMDESSRQEIILFINRIKSRTIQFTLCGLCKLDNECFMSNLVTVSGYFIIILQSYMTQIENWPTEIHSEFEGES